MENLVNHIIYEHSEERAIFVLKGIPLSTVHQEQPDIDGIMANKMAYFQKIYNQKTPIVPFEAFIALYNFITDQYKKIYIIENPIFWHLYPSDVQISDEISEKLVNHFDPDAEEEAIIDGIDDYKAVYSNYMKTDKGYIACCYNMDDSQLEREEIMRMTLPVEKKPLPLVDHINPEGYVNLCEDIDYFQLISALQQGENHFTITWSSYSADSRTVQDHLEILHGFFPGRLFSYVKQADTPVMENHSELISILKKYWNYNNFRSVRMYNLEKLVNHEKQVIGVSQEQIIQDLITQAERCMEGNNFRDIFVTAPTGSGKSLMFQIPAIYLAQKYNLLTLVITPLIGLMNDQVQALKKQGYYGAETINSDISPLVKQSIIEKIAQNQCHILYLSPESLLSRSDIEQLTGNRQIGMLVVDEAHIVTTWGKQFRPDYWYLGDHVQKLRKGQYKDKQKAKPFIIATFTATAIYEGKEDMYHETLNSLHMMDPITYLGYVKRDNISIEISAVEAQKNKIEYELNKFDALISMIQIALMRSQKTLIYFPTVALIDRFYSYCSTKNLTQHIARYHGKMDSIAKAENFREFLEGTKMIMLATKAFGMGIDIPDIAVVSHFAPTGNVCDYMQEIGRAARDERIQGHAIYRHMSNDFKHINQLYGLSAIQKYQLIEVIKKILELYNAVRHEDHGRRLTKKRNEMLVDADSFSYIFDNSFSDENEIINKVKTAMLLIQKDYENRGFSPFHMRPIPLFSYGYFAVQPQIQKKLEKGYKGSVTEVFESLHVCKVHLQTIWEHSYRKEMSFPKFKYMVYSHSQELPFNKKYYMAPAMRVEIFFQKDEGYIFGKILKTVKDTAHESLYAGKYLSMDNMVASVSSKAKMSRYRAESIIKVVLSAMNIYRREISNRMSVEVFRSRINRDGNASYQFLSGVDEFFAWIQRNYEYTKKHINDHCLYIVNDAESSVRCKEVLTALGILESFSVLRFQSLGGSNSQIYIYVSETKNMQMVRDKPAFYRNRLLEMIDMRHKESVAMLTFLFQNHLTSEQVWNYLEDYFLGVTPKELSQAESLTD
jgi:ATP-dependent DNA helicase RecQ